MKKFEWINFQIRRLIDEGIVNPNIGIAMPAVPVKIKVMTYHAKRRGISQEEAQQYIDTAEAMFVQGNGERQMYLSVDGASTLLVKNGWLISVYSKATFDNSIKSILGVLQNA